MIDLANRYTNVEIINKDYVRGLLSRRDRAELLIKLYYNDVITFDTYKSELSRY